MLQRYVSNATEVARPAQHVPSKNIPPQHPSAMRWQYGAQLAGLCWRCFGDSPPSLSAKQLSYSVHVPGASIMCATRRVLRALLPGQSVQLAPTYPPCSFQPPGASFMCATRRVLRPLLPGGPAQPVPPQVARARRCAVHVRHARRSRRDRALRHPPPQVQSLGV